MARKTNNIRKRKDGRWEARYKIGTYENGRTKYKSIYASTYSEVKEKLGQAFIDTEHSCSNSKKLTFSEVLDLWIETNKISLKESTIFKYNYMISKHIKPELGHKDVSKLTSLEISNFIFRKSKDGRLDKSGGLSPSYVKTILLIINSAINFAVTNKFCAPLNSISGIPSTTKKDLPILSQTEQKKLEAYIINQSDATCTGIMISLHTGLRIGEICALTWSDIDFQNKIIHVRHTITKGCSEHSKKPYLMIGSPKTKSSMRDIPISEFLLYYLTIAYNSSRTQFVISNGNTFLNPRTYEYRFHRILTKCALPSINYHALRHTFATRCIEVGVDIKSLSEILGHSSVSITLGTYVHSSMELKRIQLEKLPCYAI